MIGEALARARRLLAPATVPAPIPSTPAPSATVGQGGWVAVCVLGLDGAVLDQVIATAQAEAQAVGRRPVFITDGDRLEPFRERRAVVEQVVDPRAAARRAPDLAWDLYRLRQFHLLARKWRPSAVVTFGTRPPADCLDALRAARPVAENGSAAATTNGSRRV
jgi:hypothetical protein